MDDQQAFEEFHRAWREWLVLPDGWAFVSLEREDLPIETNGHTTHYVQSWTAAAIGPFGERRAAADITPQNALWQLRESLNR